LVQKNCDHNIDPRKFFRRKKLIDRCRLTGDDQLQADGVGAEAVDALAPGVDLIKPIWPKFTDT
jgi:hypothetical protein